MATEFVFPLEAAADFLVFLVSNGVEFPEAQYRASVKFEVDPDELRAEYDSRSA